MIRNIQDQEDSEQLPVGERMTTEELLATCFLLQEHERILQRNHLFPPVQGHHVLPTQDRHPPNLGNGFFARSFHSREMPPLAYDPLPSGVQNCFNAKPPKTGNIFTLLPMFFVFVLLTYLLLHRSGSK